MTDIKSAKEVAIQNGCTYEDLYYAAAYGTLKGKLECIIDYGKSYETAEELYNFILKTCKDVIK